MIFLLIKYIDIYRFIMRVRTERFEEKIKQLKAENEDLKRQLEGMNE